MPNRILKESICSSDTLAGISPEAERLWWRILVRADDYGRFEAAPDVIRGQCLTKFIDRISNEDVLRWLAELERDLIRLYTVDGKCYLQITTWDRHQKRRAKFSKYPAPADNCKQPPADASTCEQSQTIAGLVVFEERGTRNEESSASENVSANADEDEVVSSGPSVPYTHIVNLYHQHCPTWPKVDILTPARRQSIREWWATLNGETHRFELAFQKASASDFLSGRNSKWKSPKPCDLDWLLKESNLAVVLEGGYDEHKRPEPHRPPPPEAILPMSDEESAEGLAQLRELAAKLQRVPGGKREVAP